MIVARVKKGGDNDRDTARQKETAIRKSRKSRKSKNQNTIEFENRKYD